MADWNEYFSKTRPPSNLDEAKRTIQDFAIKHRQLSRNIVLVTSGGTTVPIESNTVRFVDNFSQGTRGACSAEYFLMQGYAVIFLHRQRSYEPFCRHFEGHNALDLMELQVDNNGSFRVTVDESRAPGLTDIVRRYKEVQSGCLLLKIGFMTLSDYLFLLRASAEALSPLGSHVMFYLAAAVSDFYIPENEMAEHKIQSSEGGFSLHMSPTPKMLSPLVKEWAKSAFVVSFKLETDVNIISRKAREALQKYNHQVVIANILQTRKKTVVLVTPFDEVPIWMSDQDLEMGKEIEEKIVSELTRRHFATSSANNENTHQQQSPVVNSNVNFPHQQYHTQTSMNAASSVSSSMPGLAPINVYQQNAINTKAGGMQNVHLLHLKSTNDAEVSSDVITSNLLKRSVSAKEDTGGLTVDMQEFIREFKTRRVNLGYTQDDVGRELSALKGPTYSQSFISRFEGKQLGMKAADRMRPILESWIQSKEEEHNRGNKFTKKRRKRTSFPPEYVELLSEHFQKNPKPTNEEMHIISQKLDLDITTVKVWFCNKKQSMKRLGQPVQRNTLRADLEKRKRKSEADIADVFPLSAHGQLKTLLPVSTPTGTVTMPFFISPDGNPIPIVSATSGNNVTVNSTSQAGVTNPLSTQQIVHLSQLPILTSMAVVNNGIHGAATPDGATQQILSNGRIIHPGSVLQIPGSSITAHQQMQGNISQSTPTISDGTVIIAPSETLSAVQGTDNNNRNIHIMPNTNTTMPENGMMTGDTRRHVNHNENVSSQVLNNNVSHNVGSNVATKTEESSEICVSAETNKNDSLLHRTVIERNEMSVHDGKMSDDND